MTNHKDYKLIITQKSINFAPTSLLEEISQNIITICTTAKFSVPMDRAFGIKTAFLDTPITSAKTKFCSEVVEAVRRFEPRARITSIDFQADSMGLVRPVIHFKIIAA